MRRRCAPGSQMMLLSSSELCFSPEADAHSRKAAFLLSPWIRQSCEQAILCTAWLFKTCKFAYIHLCWHLHAWSDA